MAREPLLISTFTCPAAMYLYLSFNFIYFISLCQNYNICYICIQYTSSTAAV